MLYAYEHVNVDQITTSHSTDYKDFTYQMCIAFVFLDATTDVSQGVSLICSNVCMYIHMS